MYSSIYSSIHPSIHDIYLSIVSIPPIHLSINLFGM